MTTTLVLIGIASVGLCGWWLGCRSTKNQVRNIDVDTRPAPPSGGMTVGEAMEWKW